jgi:hypothetical protein
LKTTPLPAAHAKDPNNTSPAMKNNTILQIDRDQSPKTIITINFILLSLHPRLLKREPKPRTKRTRKIKKRRRRRSPRRTKRRGMVIIIMVKRRGKRVTARGQRRRRENNDCDCD